MLFSFLCISSLVLGATPLNCNANDTFIEREIIEARETFSSTFLTNKGTYVSFYFGEPINYSDEFNKIEEKIDNDSLRTDSNYSGSSYIDNKYFQVGYPETYNTDLLVGKSLILDPNGQTPEYRVVYGLNLPGFDTAHYTIRSAGFSFKRKAGTLSSVLAYKINSPSFASINGVSSLSKDFIANISLSSNYSTIDITEEVRNTISYVTSPMNLLLVGTSNNSYCSLYKNSDGNNCRPYFYIEYDNYGIAPSYNALALNTNTNCLGFILNYNQIIDINLQLATDLSNNSIINSSNNTFFDYYENMIIGIVNSQTSSFHLSTSKHINLNQPITINSRRAIMRLKINNYKYNGDYHFMCECNDGTWAEKMGTGLSGQYSSLSIAEANWGLYNSPTIHLLLTEF